MTNLALEQLARQQLGKYFDGVKKIVLRHCEITIKVVAADTKISFGNCLGSTFSCFGYEMYVNEACF